MYCAACSELMAGQTEVKNPEGYYWPYYFQLCKNCRSSDTMSESEMRAIIKTDECICDASWSGRDDAQWLACGAPSCVCKS